MKRRLFLEVRYTLNTKKEEKETMGNAQQHIGKRVEVGRYEVEAVKYLGEGGSSFIFLVKDVVATSRDPMVLKRLVAENDTAYGWIQNEINMHQRFKHPNMVEFIASQTNKKGGRSGEREVFILMEYCPNGHLYENMMKMGEKRFSERDIVRIFKTMCIPVSVLHHEDPPIAHRDIKLENYLMDRKGNYKLCDFGSCVSGTQSLKTKEDRATQMELVLKRTTAMYRSPELADIEGTAMFGSGELTEAVDIWALGCVLYTMAFFKPPFPPEGLRTERYTVPATPKYSNDLITLISRMLTADVEKRATIDHVLDCLDALLDSEPLPPLPKAGATASPRKTPKALEPVKKKEADDIKPVKKTTEARPTASAAVDLLDMDFNPTISTKSQAAPSTATASSDAMGWTTAAPSGGFADFANFPSPTASASATTASAPVKKMDQFGFPVSPLGAAAMNAMPTQPLHPQPMTSMPAQSMNPSKPDPFAAFDAFGSSPPSAPMMNPMHQNMNMNMGFRPPHPQAQAGMGMGMNMGMMGGFPQQQQPPPQQKSWNPPFQRF